MRDVNFCLILATVIWGVFCLLTSRVGLLYWNLLLDWNYLARLGLGPSIKDYSTHLSSQVCLAPKTCPFVIWINRISSQNQAYAEEKWEVWPKKEESRSGSPANTSWPCGAVYGRVQGLWGFCPWVLEFFILGIKPLSVTWFTNIFSHNVGCLLIP